jgi:hypothetical protein
MAQKTNDTIWELNSSYSKLHLLLQIAIDALAAVRLPIGVLRKEAVNISAALTTCMSDTPRGLPLKSSLFEQIFPTLTPAQIRRIAPHSHSRAMQHGEVRGGSIKRVASAVGEGSIAISFVHQVLQD